MAKLRITIAGAPFAHILYHFVLAFSRWEHVEVVEGGESFASLSKGLQNALWHAGGAERVNDFATPRDINLVCDRRCRWSALSLQVAG